MASVAHAHADEVPAVSGAEEVRVEVLRAMPRAAILASRGVGTTPPEEANRPKRGSVLLFLPHRYVPRRKCATMIDCP